LQIQIIPAFKDNYIYVLSKDKKAWVFDPGESEPVARHLSQIDAEEVAIILTHHHWDHVSGVEKLRDQFEASVWGPKDSRIPFVEHHLSSGSTSILGKTFQVISTPGHTIPALSYYIEIDKQSYLFSGDTLFAGGCGRLMEGSAKQMWDSLSRLKELPPSTLICAGHEYTQSNYTFVSQIPWRKDEVKDTLARVKAKRDVGIATYPLTLENELKSNPFLNAQDPTLKSALGLSLEDSNEACFAKLRAQKDAF